MKLGTDFSGIGSPESALKRLGLEVDEVFACEIDKYARKSFNELHNPSTMYEDVTTRNHSEVPQLDLYVAGFPCQSFSLAGKRGGFEDTRGTLFFNVAEFIKENQPKCFILENVKGLLSHDNGRTYQTITDVLTNGGGTLNGQIGLDSIDNGLGYHVYAKVLNSKDYGIPQNRERIFLVGFKEFREFRFPKKMELKLRLKGLLENEVDEKYYLSDKMIKTFTNHKERHEEKGTGFKWQPKTGDDIANCLRANAALCPTDNTIITTNNKRVNNCFNKHKENLEDGDFMDSYNQSIHKDVSPTITTRVTASNSNHIYREVISHSLFPRTSKTGKGGSGHLSKTDGTSYCVDTGCSQGVEIIRLEDLKLIVSNRTNETPLEVNQFLKDHKKGTINDISKALNLPKTKVEHYFRVDKSRAIPCVDDWIRLKTLLGFSDKYDKQVTEITKGISTFESSSRLYSSEGISPTLQTGEQGYYKTNKKIRRLTPLECWRLQGYTDEQFYAAQKVNSDTQLYKQAGNSITVNVMVELFKKIYNKL